MKSIKWTMQKGSNKIHKNTRSFITQTGNTIVHHILKVLN